MLSRPRKSLPGTEQLSTLPAPSGGLNTFSPAMGMPATDCMALYNMLAAEYGLRARLGWREWVAGLTGAADNKTRTVIPYTGSNSSATRLFVTTSTGIWDVTDSGGKTTPWAGNTDYALGDFVSDDGLAFACVDDGTSHSANGLPSLWAPLTSFNVGSRCINGDNVYACLLTGTSASGDGPTGTGTGISDGGTIWDYVSSKDSIPDGFARWKYMPSNNEPTLALTFASSLGDAGYGVAHAHSTTAGNFIWYTDEENGLHLYTESTDTWTAVSALSITGVDPADLVFVTIFKGFSIFLERGKTDAWILPVNSISGAVSRMGLGYKLQAGGDLVGAWPWTYDGGAGLDDALVVASRGGDIMVFQGTDPTDSTAFGMTGVWGVGKLPAGRNVATTFGGDLLLLTRSGVQPMSRLVLGRTEGAAQYETGKIQNLFNSLMLSRGDLRGWSLVLHPEESALIVTVPVAEGAATVQLAMTLTTRSWSQLRDLEIFSCAPHEGKLYFGTTDGKVCINDGNVDGVLLSDPDAFEAIEYSGISAFQNLGSGTQKQVHLIRPRFVSQATAPTFSVGARYDFDLSELDAVTYSPSTEGSVWDTGEWDEATWSGTYLAHSEVRGSSGMGANVAIVWRGVSVDRAVLVGFELSFSTGGML